MGIVFCSTLFLYSIHRIIGISKIRFQLIDGRYRIILKYRSHLKIYGGIAFIGLLYFLLSTTLEYLYFLIPLGLVSVLYALPILFRRKRLRDFHYIKIFLIALVWGGIAVGQILVRDNSIILLVLLILFIEKVIYIVAITLPFDVRDLKIDASLSTKTLPQYIGVQSTYRLTYVLLFIGLISYITLCYYDNQSATIPYIILAYFLSIFIVYISKGKRSDYYYSGLLDGVIGVRSLIIIIGCLA